MEPAYPVGSLVYVRSVAAETVEAGDPIAFVMNGDGVVAIHRVVSVDAAAATFRTKGDANDAPDAAPVAFASLIGMPVLCVPYLGYVSDYLTRPPGLYLGGAAALLAVVLLLLPDRERAARGRGGAPRSVPWRRRSARCARRRRPGGACTAAERAPAGANELEHQTGPAPRGAGSTYRSYPKKIQKEGVTHTMKKKTIILILSLALVVAFAATGAVAWLTAVTDPVQNTFTVGNIDLKLEETTTDYTMVPGNDIAKDPKVTVLGGSEDCWLFVKVEESDNLCTFIEYAVADGWTALPGVAGVYYREVAASETDQAFAVLQGDIVSVPDSVTKDMMDALTEETAPTLTFTAYAVQKANIATAADAWAAVQPAQP